MTLLGLAALAILFARFRRAIRWANAQRIALESSHDAIEESESWLHTEAVVEDLKLALKAQNDDRRTHKTCTPRETAEVVMDYDDYDDYDVDDADDDFGLGGVL